MNDPPELISEFEEPHYKCPGICCLGCIHDQPGEEPERIKLFCLLDDKMFQEKPE